MTPAAGGAPPDGLRAQGLVAARGGTLTLRGVSIHLQPGRLVALLGPNGAGKSSLLLALSGVLRLRRGTIHLGPRRIDGLAAERIARLGVAHIPQGRHLFTELTVRENLGLARFAARPGRALEPAEVWAERFPGIAGRLDAAAGLLSGGQQQLVAVARGLLCGPDVVLCDEPTAALAPGMRDAVLAELRRRADAGAAVLVAEQDVEAVLRVADGQAVMRAGTLVGAAA